MTPGSYPAISNPRRIEHLSAPKTLKTFPWYLEVIPKETKAVLIRINELFQRQTRAEDLRVGRCQDEGADTALAQRACMIITCSISMHTSQVYTRDKVHGLLHTYSSYSFRECILHTFELHNIANIAISDYAELYMWLWYKLGIYCCGEMKPSKHTHSREVTSICVTVCM